MDELRQALHLRGRHAGRGKERVPAGGHQVQTGFLEGGHVRRQRAALGAGDSQDAHLARVVLGQQAVQGVESHWHLAADQIRGQRGRAAVAHDFSAHLGGIAHHQAKEVRKAAGGWHAEVGFFRVGAQPGQQVGQLLHWHGAAHGHAKLVAVHMAHGAEVALGVVARVGEHQRCHHHHGRVGQQQRGLVGGRGLHILGREATTRARLVLDDDGAAQLGLQLVGHDAGHAVAGTAGWVAHHQAQGRIGRSAGGLGLGAGRAEHQCGGQTESRGQQGAPGKVTCAGDGVGHGVLLGGVAGNDGSQACIVAL